jgi:hypothetical protein
MGAAAVPIALAVGGALVNRINTTRTARKQDSATAEGIRRQAEEQRKANAKINETLNFFQESEAGDIRDRLSQRYTDQLRLKQAQGLAGFDTAGDSSDAFKGRSAQRQSDVVGRADVLQDLFSRIDAADDQRLLEGFERGDLGSDLSINARNSAAENYLTQLRLASIQRSPWLDILAAGLSGAASGTASGGAFGRGGVPATIAGSGGQTPQTFFSASSAARLPRQVGTPTGRVFNIFGP